MSPRRATGPFVDLCAPHLRGDKNSKNSKGQDVGANQPTCQRSLKTAAVPVAFGSGPLLGGPPPPPCVPVAAAGAGDTRYPPTQREDGACPSSLKPDRTPHAGTRQAERRVRVGHQPFWPRHEPVSGGQTGGFVVGGAELSSSRACTGARRRLRLWGERGLQPRTCPFLRLPTPGAQSRAGGQLWATSLVGPVPPQSLGLNVGGR